MAGFYVDPEDLVDHGDEPNAFYEYWVNHEGGLYMAQRTFHVCQAHPDAQKVLNKGVLKPDFACPFGRKNGQCPMLKILSEEPGKAFIFIDQTELNLTNA